MAAPCCLLVASLLTSLPDLVPLALLIIIPCRLLSDVVKFGTLIGVCRIRHNLASSSFASQAIASADLHGSNTRRRRGRRLGLQLPFRFNPGLGETRSIPILPKCSMFLFRDGCVKCLRWCISVPLSTTTPSVHVPTQQISLLCTAYHSSPTTNHSPHQPTNHRRLPHPTPHLLLPSPVSTCLRSPTHGVSHFPCNSITHVTEPR
jgi:hypothetical protein